ncbi:SLATT domain-containing protein [Deinococcus phoenicis]|uniref:SLATT domain-containing protein n=1 Tax=Deinococcus phoenicis TaxID=1476583 RepID=UPI001268E49B
MFWKKSFKTSENALPEKSFVGSKVIIKLYEDVDITSRNRFNAAKRCDRLNSLSNWTTSLISLLLIAIPVLQNLKVEPFNSSNQAQNSVSIILAVFILVFSQIQNIENYSLKAFRYHECAMRLTLLRRELSVHRESVIQLSSYRDYVSKYYGILSEYENHIDADYQLTLWQNQAKEIAKAIKEGHSAPNYPKTFGISDQCWQVMFSRLNYTARFTAAILLSLVLTWWSVFVYTTTA